MFVVVYIALLIVSAFLYGAPISIVLACVICIAGFLPILAGFALNVWLVHFLSKEIEPRRRAIDTRMSQLKAQAAKASA